MHVRFTTLVGMSVTDDRMEEDIGRICGILIHPDTAVIEGFFVSTSVFLQKCELFLSTADIVHLGSRVRIRDADRLAPLEDLVRLSALQADSRTVLHQKIVTQSGVKLGMCADVQLETKTFRIEWLFPKKWFRWRRPVAAASIVEVKTDAIVVRDPVIPLQVTEAEAVLQALEPLPA